MVSKEQQRKKISIQRLKEDLDLKIRLFTGEITPEKFKKLDIKSKKKFIIKMRKLI